MAFQSQDAFMTECLRKISPTSCAGNEHAAIPGWEMRSCISRWEGQRAVERGQADLAVTEST
jgi:hypothetical protein